MAWESEGLHPAAVSTMATDASTESAFEQAIRRYQEGAEPTDLIPEFEAIIAAAPRLAAGWTCLAWLQLLDDQPLAALRSARTAVKLNPQDPQSRVNLSVAMLETGAKGVREHIDMVLRVTAVAPELGEELQESIADGLRRRPGWTSLEKVSAWLKG
jgi:predicted Zn-dependent protease